MSEAKTLVPRRNKEIKLNEKDIERFWRGVDRCDDEDCWNWKKFKDCEGYGYIRINKGNFMAHRVSATISFGEIPQGMLVCHKCDNPSCCNPNHLFFGSDLDNNRDKKIKGRARSLKGEASKNSKLTQADVNLIRFAYGNGGYTFKALGNIFGVSLHTVHGIVKNATWRYETYR